jgi:hypothetical protein
MKAVETETLVILGALTLVTLGAAYLLKKAASVPDAVGGIFTGNNAITKNATNAAGEKVTAYEGAGILGTLGAATNAVSGGTLASLGQAIGGAVADLRDAIRPPLSVGPITPANTVTAQFDAMGNYIGTF